MRARNIKPGFFMNEEIGELTIAERLLFIGLWCFSDRDGYFKNKPKRMAAEIFPYDRDISEDNIAEMLCHLMSLHLITLNEHIGYVNNFDKHQHPHPHEAKSTIGDDERNSLLNQCHDMSLHVIECQADIINKDIINKDIRITATPPSKPSKKKTSQIPEDFSYTDEMEKKAREYGFCGDLKKETQNFIDYWLSKGECRANWQASWRMWIRRSIEYSKRDEINGSASPQMFGGLRKRTL